MEDSPYVLQEAGLSPAEPPDDPDAPRGRLAWLWSVLAMAAIVGAGGVIGVVSERYAEDAPRINPDQEITTELATELCRDAMLDLGIDRFTVPPYIPDVDGSNLQTPFPWKVGETVVVVPHREMVEGQFGMLEPERHVLCTITGR